VTSKDRCGALAQMMTCGRTPINATAAAASRQLSDSSVAAAATCFASSDGNHAVRRTEGDLACVYIESMSSERRVVHGLG